MFNFYKLIVAGGREFDDYDLVDRKLTAFRRVIIKDDIADDLEIVCGKCRGADTLGENWAKANHVGIEYFPADWKRTSDGSYDRSAGYKRNRKMGNYADGLLAFWDGESRGTKGMIDYATKKGLDVFVVKY